MTYTSIELAAHLNRIINELEELKKGLTNETGSWNIDLCKRAQDELIRLKNNINSALNKP